MFRSLAVAVLAFSIASPAFAMQRPPKDKGKGGDPAPVSVQRPPNHKDKGGGGDPAPVSVQRPPHHKDKGGGGDPAP
jgi:hypothetical protein